MRRRAPSAPDAMRSTSPGRTRGAAPCRRSSSPRSASISGTSPFARVTVVGDEDDGHRECNRKRDDAGQRRNVEQPGEDRSYARDPERNEGAADEQGDDERRADDEHDPDAHERELGRRPGFERRRRGGRGRIHGPVCAGLPTARQPSAAASASRALAAAGPGCWRRSRARRDRR